MKKGLLLILICILIQGGAYAIEGYASQNSMSDIEVYSDDGKFGLRTKSEDIITEAEYQKLIRLGETSWIVQKKNKFGIMDCDGNFIIKPKYRQAERILGKFVKLGNDNDYGIYDENGSLIYMVNGGTGGEGGKIWNSASGAYSGENGQSGRNYQMLITANANLLTTIAMDEDYLSSLATIQANPDFKDENGGDISNLVARRLTYRKLQEEPYLELNKRKNENEDFTNNVANKSGGFSGFDKTNVELSNNQYDGLYYRGLIDNQGAYIGGLGGFSGLANKAGCGGYFMGNFDGRQNAQGTLPNDETTRKNNINTFSYNNVSYNVSDFYENCSTNSPNGQSAEFIPPIPNSSNLGSAGSGGGGGGYNIQRGSGNGGDGQDGYVMIEWRK